MSPVVAFPQTPFLFWTFQFLTFLLKVFFSSFDCLRCSFTSLTSDIRICGWVLNSQVEFLHVLMSLKSLVVVQESMCFASSSDCCHFPTQFCQLLWLSFDVRSAHKCQYFSWMLSVNHFSNKYCKGAAACIPGVLHPLVLNHRPPRVFSNRKTLQPRSTRVPPVLSQNHAPRRTFPPLQQSCRAALKIISTKL